MLLRNLQFLMLLIICSLGFINNSVAQLYVEKLDKLINTDQFDELGPVLDTDNKTLYFTRVASPDFISKYNDEEKSILPIPLAYILSEIAGEQIDDAAASQYNQDIWIAKLNELGKIRELIHPDYPVNNAYPNSVCSILPKENALIVLNQFPDDGTVQEGFSKVVRNSDGSFEKPSAMEVFDYKDDLLFGGQEI